MLDRPAGMHDIDWNDLRYVLALAREKSYAAAARRLRIDPTTVARRIREIEASLDVRLFERGAAGDFRATEAGDIAARRAEIIETEIGGLTAAVKGNDGLPDGTVRVTAVPLLINHVIMPAVAGLTAQHPGLRLELVAEPRDLSLVRREADIALRLARPRDDAGSRMIARRIGSLTYAVYAATSWVDDATHLPWLSYEDGMSHLPQGQWTAALAERHGGRLAAVAVNDGEALLQAVRSGLGQAFLPVMVAQGIPGLSRIDVDVDIDRQVGSSGALSREIWLLTHPDLRGLARVTIVLDWLEDIFARTQSGKCGAS
jgi:DNA-binding transcriptional LysR family regulator